MSFSAEALAVISEVVIGNPVSLKNKDFWIPVFMGMTAPVVLQGLLQEPQEKNIKLIYEFINAF